MSRRASRLSGAPRHPERAFRPARPAPLGGASPGSAPGRRSRQRPVTCGKSPSVWLFGSSVGAICRKSRAERRVGERRGFARRRRPLALYRAMQVSCDA